MTLTDIGKLSPEQIRAIYSHVLRIQSGLSDKAGPEFEWLCDFARVLLSAGPNFVHLQPVATLFIVKYRIHEWV